MGTIKKMNNEFFDILSDYFFASIAIVGTVVGLDTIPDNQTIIQVLTTPASESVVDVTQKLMTIVSLLISSVAGMIPIFKTYKKIRKKRK